MRLKFYLPLFIVLFILSACNQSDKTEGIISGYSQIVADESFFTIVDDEAEIFGLNYKTAKIDFIYKPEKELLKLFLKDSIKTAIMARALTAEEKKHFESKKIVIRLNRFAIDAIAIIVNSKNADSLITLNQLNEALVGIYKSNFNWVFDNAQSSTVSYVMDKFKVSKLPANFYSLKSNKEVIEYVSKNTNSIGIISLSWLVRPTKDVEQYLPQIKLLAVKNIKGKYVTPNQSSLKTNDYPLSRGLYIINCQGSAGLGTGFASFIAGELGQRIILKSGLAPDSLPTRLLNIK